MTNEQKRRALLAEIGGMKKAFEARLDALADDDSLDDAAYYAAISKATAEYDAAMWPKWWQAVALRYPLRGGWFGETFAPQFGVCDNKRLSAKQTEVFRRYCEGDQDSCQTGRYYTRIKDRLIILDMPKYAHGIGYLTIKAI